MKNLNCTLIFVVSIWTLMLSDLYRRWSHCLHIRCILYPVLLQTCTALSHALSLAGNVCTMKNVRHEKTRTYGGSTSEPSPFLLQNLRVRWWLSCCFHPLEMKVMQTAECSVQTEQRAPFMSKGILIYNSWTRLRLLRCCWFCS